MSKTAQYIDTTCDNCNKTITQKLIQYNRSNHHFCNIECKKQWQTKKINVKCDNCGKIVVQKQSQFNRAKHHYCCNKCQKEYEHKEKYEQRICLICNKLFEVSKLSSQNLCSVECQHQWQKTQIGSLNSHYNRKQVKCEYCHKIYEARNYKLTNGQHLFCSVKCRQNWYSNIWSQEEKWKEESRIRAAKLLQNRVVDTNTKPQQIINNILEEMKIEYVNEENFKYYSVDNYLPQYNLIIEVMGDFWHCNPLKYKNACHTIQSNRIVKDKAKRTYIKNIYGIEVLYLWEDDIYNKTYLCKKLIREYIKNQGNLENYHSFNYHIIHNKLKLNSDLIYSYFEK